VTTVVLTGRPRGVTHLAVDALAELPSDLRLIGGLAVLCRVGMPHRATVDLDALTRDLAIHDVSLQRLALSSTGGGQYVMPGELDLDVIEVAPDDASVVADSMGAPDSLTDLEFNVIAHTWAHDSATPLDVTVASADDGVIIAAARDRLVASTPGLIAMKATTVPLRASARPEKRASDLYDIGRLMTTAARQEVADALAVMPPALRDEILARLQRWFVEPSGRDRTFREIRRFDEAQLELDDVAFTVEAVTSPES
jgi:hypothetical protein